MNTGTNNFLDALLSTVTGGLQSKIDKRRMIEMVRLENDMRYGTQHKLLVDEYGYKIPIEEAKLKSEYDKIAAILAGDYIQKGGNPARLPEFINLAMGKTIPAAQPQPSPAAAPVPKIPMGNIISLPGMSSDMSGLFNTTPIYQNMPIPVQQTTDTAQPPAGAPGVEDYSAIPHPEYNPKQIGGGMAAVFSGMSFNDRQQTTDLFRQLNDVYAASAQGFFPKNDAELRAAPIKLQIQDIGDKYGKDLSAMTGLTGAEATASNLEASRQNAWNIANMEEQGRNRRSNAEIISRERIAKQGDEKAKREAEEKMRKGVEDKTDKAKKAFYDAATGYANGTVPLEVVQSYYSALPTPKVMQGNSESYVMMSIEKGLIKPKPKTSGKVDNLKTILDELRKK